MVSSEVMAGSPVALCFSRRRADGAAQRASKRASPLYRWRQIDGKPPALTRIKTGRWWGRWYSSAVNVVSEVAGRSRAIEAVRIRSLPRVSCCTWQRCLPCCWRSCTATTVYSLTPSTTRTSTLRLPQILPMATTGSIPARRVAIVKHPLAVSSGAVRGQRVGDVSATGLERTLLRYRGVAARTNRRWLGRPTAPTCVSDNVQWRWTGKLVVAVG